MWLLFVRRVFSSLRNPLWSALFLCSSSHENACPSPCSCPVRGAAACSITDGVWDNAFWSCTIFLPTSLLLTPLPFHAYQNHHVCSCRWCHIKDGNFFGLFCWEEVMQACKYLNSEPWIFPHWFHELSTRDPGTLSLYSYHTCWLGQSMSCGHGMPQRFQHRLKALFSESQLLYSYKFPMAKTWGHTTAHQHCICSLPRFLQLAYQQKNRHVRVDTTLADDCFKVDLAPLVWWHGTKKKNRKNSLQKSRKSWILVQRTLKPVSCVTFTVSWISPYDASLPPHLQSMGYLMLCRHLWKENFFHPLGQSGQSN